VACIGRTPRTAAGDRFGWHASTGPDVDKRDGHIFVNNLLTGDKSFDRPLLFVWQPASLCERLSDSQLKQLDHNVYVRGKEKPSSPLILWSPATSKDCQAGFESLDSLRRIHPEFSANSRSYLSYDGPLFKSKELDNYELLSAFPGSKSGVQVPAEIGKVLGQSKKDDRYVGAYPPEP
jgi:hypothetical protein